jgi:hypothetical protein
MTKRDQTYQLVKVAGYHNDGRTATRVLIENPISIKRYNEAWQEGVSARKQGMRCLCRDCAGGRP